MRIFDFYENMQGNIENRQSVALNIQIQKKKKLF